MKKAIIILLLWSVCTTIALAQYSRTFNGRIMSLQVVAGTRWTDMPIIELGSDEAIHIDFDDMTHESRRYTYKVEHCEADWSISDELLESDYIEGFASGNTIDDLQESVNTNVLYIHYHLALPNDRCRMKMSGNYRVTVYDEDNDNEKMMEACFMIMEPLMGLTMQVTTNTDGDINGRHQQLRMELNYGNRKINDWKREIRTVVYQNGRWDNPAVNPTPQYVKPDGLAWNHCRKLIFDGGNEFRKFEILDTDRPSMGIDHVGWDGKEYHAFLWTDEPRPNYLYDEDANGAFFIRNSDNTEIDYTAEYMTVHFRLKIPRQDGDVYLNGRWTGGLYLPPYRMKWNQEEQCYENQVRLKQGYYNYQYVRIAPDGRPVNLASEGNYFQTENCYTALVYYKPLGGRSDRLVACCSATSRR